jgi:hypothetical protein
MKQALVAFAIALGTTVGLSGTASAANDYSAWASCEHGLSVELIGWSKAYTVTITDNGLPLANATNKGGTKFAHTESDKSAFPLTDKTSPHVYVVNVTAADPSLSFTDTVNLGACGAAWPGYAYTTPEP